MQDKSVIELMVELALMVLWMVQVSLIVMWAYDVVNVPWFKVFWPAMFLAAHAILYAIIIAPGKRAEELEQPMFLEVSLDDLKEIEKELDRKQARKEAKRERKLK